MHKGQHTCEICSDNFTTDNNLKRHISNKHDNKQDKFFLVYVTRLSQQSQI